MAAPPRRFSPGRGPPDAATPPSRKRPGRKQPLLAIAPPQGTIRSIAVKGTSGSSRKRFAPTPTSTGPDLYHQTLDQALKDLYATQLFADVTISGGDTGDLVIAVKENPVINRIILEGNKRLKDEDHARDQALAAPDLHALGRSRRRRADPGAVSPPGPLRRPRRAQDRPTRPEPGRRLFEIYEGDLAKVRAINILGNNNFGDERLRKEMYTCQAGGILGFVKSNDTLIPTASPPTSRSFAPSI